MKRYRLSANLWLAAALLGVVSPAAAAELRGRIVDAETKSILPARLYIRSAGGKWFFAESAADGGSSVRYDKRRSEESLEVHTTLSADPFVADLPPGEYLLVAERGKEYHAARKMIQMDDESSEVVLELRRWIDMSQLGWYSGDTHVHRELGELPNLLLAEDLNVAFPLTYWVTHAGTRPSQGDKNSTTGNWQLIEVDRTHVIYPLNTEYEIFTVGDQRHTLGAIFALNHRSVLERGVPPVRPIAEQVHGEGGLLELDKHNWPWSMMLVPVMDVDLYELSNNHIWRTEFLFRGYGEAAADYMQIERDAAGWTERGWIDFTHKNYHLLLNCGFRLRPTAGTASGVHPVPLGFGRVYVHLADNFSYPAWVEGLDRGRSFVTTGPMLHVQLNGELPGAEFRPQRERNEFQVTGWARSSRPLQAVEVIVNGEVRARIAPENRQLAEGGYETKLDQSIELAGSGWFAVRCFSVADGARVRFAHSAPFHVVVAGQPLQPRREEVEYLIRRVTDQITRNQRVLDAAALEEYQQAREAYEALLPQAR